MPRKHTDPTHRMRIWTSSAEITASFPLPWISLPPRRARPRLRTRGAILRSERLVAEAALSRWQDEGGADNRSAREPAVGVAS